MCRILLNLNDLQSILAEGIQKASTDFFLLALVDLRNLTTKFGSNSLAI